MGTLGSLIRIDRERGLLEMDGHETFMAAVPTMAGVARDLCTQAGIELSDVSLFVFHQANGRILKGVAEHLELDPERVVDCIAHVGNTSAASVAIALSMAADEGRIPENGTVVLAAFGAGLSWAGAVLNYGDRRRPREHQRRINRHGGPDRPPSHGRGLRPRDRRARAASAPPPPRRWPPRAGPWP